MREFFKKQKPLLGLEGSGGGLGFFHGGGGADVTGGTKTEISGYTVHTFLSSGSLVVSGEPVSNVQYLVVGGGGGGGMGAFTGAAGGGGGGLRSSVPGKPGGGNGGSVEPTINLDVATYTITVGAGGGIAQYPVSQSPVSPSAGQAGSRGGDSSIVGPGPVSVIAYGGGGGGGYQTSGQPGGSGGGGGAQDSTTQYGGTGNRDSSNNATPSQGFNGGTALYGSGQDYAGGGGGGAGGTGTQSNPNSTSAHCDGGPGLPNNIDGNDYCYAGGGGGTGYETNGGDGGKGGGGGGNNAAAAPANPPTSGGGSARNAGQPGGGGPTAPWGPNGAGKNAGKGGTNTGGGGGGCQSGNPYFVSPPATGNDAGFGGSGIVIIRYPSS